MVGTVFCEKSGFELIELEEAVLGEGGCWLKLLKVPNPNPATQAAGGKAAPAKPVKGATTTDDVKPVVGRAWFNLESLRKPGSTSCSGRVFIETMPTCQKDESDKYVDSEETNQVFEAERTYVQLSLQLSKPLVSLESLKPAP
jgi:hypothetical protein